MAFHYSPNIASDDSLMIYLDVQNSKSYPGTGTTWSDLSRKNTNATLLGTTLPSYVQEGTPVINKSLLFNGAVVGASSYASIPNVNIGNYGTVNIWFRQNAIVTNKGLIGLGPNTFFYIGGTGQDTQLTMYNNTGTGGYTPGILIKNTSWNFASFTWDPFGVTIYLNGVAYVINMPFVFDKSGTLVIGGYPTLNTNNFLNGNISNVQIYNRKLSSNEIFSNYEAHKSRYL